MAEVQNVLPGGGKVGKVMPLFQGDNRLDRFAPVGIRRAQHGGHPDRGMPVQGFLHFPGPDLEPGGVNHILFAVNDIKVAPPIHISQVAGVEPALPNSGGGGFRLLPVAAHHLRAAQDQLADFPHRHNLGSGVGVDDAGIGIRQRQSDGAGFGGVDRIGVGQRRGFGQAVALNQHGTAHQGVKGFLDRPGQRRGAGTAGPQRGQVVKTAILVVQQGNIHRRDAEESGGPVILKGLQHPGGAETAEQHYGSPHGQGNGHHPGNAANVKQRQGGDKDFPPRFVAEPVPELDGVGNQVGMGQHTAFGYPGSAAGIGQQG